MLQEILLSLSGVPSPIWQKLKEKTGGEDDALQNYVSAPEQAMLASLSHLSQLHIEVRDSANTISSKHASLVCRAVSSSIVRRNLATFRQHVIDVESSVVKKDTLYVGGYQIVPLSTLVADFAPWTRRLEWLRKVTHFMKGRKVKSVFIECTAASILNFLEAERHTGFTDIEDIASQLLVVAETVWMRSIASWILYGQLPPVGQNDFMVREPVEGSTYDRCILEQTLIPGFVTTLAAECVLAIGTALRQIRGSNTTKQSQALQSVTSSLLLSHLDRIKTLEYPLNASSLESAMVSINESISQHTLSSLVPRSRVIEICRSLRDYMLLNSGEFAVTLIQNCDARVLVRQKSQSSVQPVRKLGRAADFTFKDTELDTILSKTWSDLAILQGQVGMEDETFTIAKQHMHLKLVHDTNESNTIDSFATILPVPTLLRIITPASSPLHIFLSASNSQLYSYMCAYLLSVRRSQLRLSNLWTMTAHRRCHPTPIGPPLSATDFGQRSCKQRRDREGLRARQMRRFWSSMNKTLFLLNELNNYLQVDIIGNSWKCFESWLYQVGLDQNEPLKEATKLTSSNTSTSINEGSRPASSLQRSVGTNRRKDDPRTLAQAHTVYLCALYSALLLDSERFLTTTRQLLQLIDHFVALFGRLSTVWEGLDLQEDDGVMDAFTNLAQDEKDIVIEMDRARDELEALLEQLVKDIKDVERARDIDDVSGGIAGLSAEQDRSSHFVPWKARTLDRLIMKLDFLYSNEDRTDDLVTDTTFD